MDSAWRQINVAFADWQAAERTAVTHLAPLLATTEHKQLVSAWFFIRKSPCWRIRYLPRCGDQRADTYLRHRLDDLARAGCIDAVTNVVYEPEVHAFGGADGMACAHRLFHDDSRHLLAHLADTGRGGGAHRRELSILLCTTMLRAAGLDWYEQGHVWALVAEHRDAPPPDRVNEVQASMRRLLSVDATTVMRNGQPLGFAAGWAAAFAAAGRQMADLAAGGLLHRGLRAILAHHVIFVWNRHGLPAAAQSVLAHTAQQVVFGPDPTTEE